MIQKRNILAIDPGLREIGVAHFIDNELVDYGVKSLRRPGNYRRRLSFLASIINRLFHEKHPDILAIEKNSFSHIRQNLALMIAIQRIKRLATGAKINVYEFAPNTIKKEITGDGRATKRQVVRVLCSQFPELAAYRESNRQWREKYYQNMFDAVACALTYLKLHEEKRLKD